MHQRIFAVFHRPCLFGRLVPILKLLTSLTEQSALTYKFVISSKLRPPQCTIHAELTRNTRVYAWKITSYENSSINDEISRLRHRIKEQDRMIWSYKKDTENATEQGNSFLRETRLETTDDLRQKLQEKERIIN
jgi:hypothetical protein